MSYSSCRVVLCTGVLACTLGAWTFPASCAESGTSTNTIVRSRDDRSAALTTFALQAVQQLQTQQRATLQAIQEARDEAEFAAHRNEQRVESLRHLLYAFCLIVGAAMLAAALYVRSLLRAVRNGTPLPSPFGRVHGSSAPDVDHVARFTALMARGQMLLEQRNPLEALACFEQAIASEPPTANALIKRATALERLGRLDEALGSYEQALALDVSHADAYIGKGNVLNRLERYREALACFEQASNHQLHLHSLPPSANAPV